LRFIPFDQSPFRTVALHGAGPSAISPLPHQHAFAGKSPLRRKFDAQYALPSAASQSTRARNTRGDINKLSIRSVARDRRVTQKTENEFSQMHAISIDEFSAAFCVFFYGLIIY